MSSIHIRGSSSRISCLLKKRKPILQSAGLLLLAVAVLSSCSGIDEGAGRGSLVAFDKPVVPDRFQGLWASPKDACNVTRDYGVQMQIAEGMIGNMTITNIYGYSDYPDIVVTTESREGDSGVRENMSLQLVRNGNMLRAKRDSDLEPMLFYRCRLN